MGGRRIRAFGTSRPFSERQAEARDPLERAVVEFPRDATVLEHLGDLYDRVGDRTRAGSLWRRALDNGSTDPDALNAKIARAEAQPAAEPSRSRGGEAANQAPPSAAPRPR